MSNQKSGKSGLGEFIGGLVMFGICLGLTIGHIGPGWILLLGIFVGAFPMVKGLRRMFRDGETRRLEDSERGRSREIGIQRAVLELASRNNGIVTPVALALEANVPIEHADASLQEMASKGYVEMNLLDSGTIEYVIREFRR